MKHKLHLILFSTLLLLSSCDDRPTKFTSDGNTPEIAEDPSEIWKNVNEIVGESPIVALGEPSHFLEGIHEFNKELFIYLMENKGFRAFCFESFWELEFALQDYMQSDREELSPLENFYLNAFGSKQTRELLMAIREFNKKNPNDKVHIFGVQPEQPVSDTKAILSFFEQTKFKMPKSAELLFAKTPTVSEEFNTDLDAVIAASAKRKEGLPAFTEEEYNAVLDVSFWFLDFLEENKEDIVAEIGVNEYTLLLQRGLSLNAYGEIWMKELNAAFAPDITPEASERITKLIYQKGDSIRAELFNATLDTRLKDKKVMVWMHNWHVSKRAELSGGDPEKGHPPVGTKSFGSRMLEKYGDSYVLIGSVVGCKECEYDRSMAIEERLFQKFGSDTVLINLKSASKEIGDLKLNENGTYWVQAGGSNFEGVNPLEQFDAIYYLSKSELTFGKPK